MQKLLNPEQISAFYHDEFVQNQVDHFSKIISPNELRNKLVVDIGGGYGYFSYAIKKKLNALVRVIDTDYSSIQHARDLGLDATIGDALNPIKSGDEKIICFNLILHHLVAPSDKKTLDLQKQALNIWRDDNIKIFVNEYTYNSWFDGFSGWFIYQITSSKLFSLIAKTISKRIPSLHANTFGVGVRFRSNIGWKKVFKSAGFEVVNEIRGEEEYITFARRLLLIKSIRRDSFLLKSI